MIVPMKRLRLAGLKSLAPAVINKIYSAGAVHVSAPSEDPAFEGSSLSSGLFLEEGATRYAAAENVISRIKASLVFLSATSGESFPAETKPGEEWLHEALSKGPFGLALERANELAERSHAIGAELKEVSTYRKLFDEFQPLIEKVESVRGMAISGVTFPPEAVSAYDEMKERLEEVTNGACAVFRGEDHEGVVALVMYPLSSDDDVRRFVFGHKVRPVHVPEKFEKETFASTLRFLFTREIELNKEVTAIERELESISAQWRNRFEAALAGVTSILGPLSAQKQLLNSDTAFWISGWIPASKADGLKSALDAEFGGAVVCYLRDPAKKEYPDTPVMLENYRPVRPFERLVDLYSTPMYGAFDPTPVIAVSMPLLFGFMLGDAGYAIFLALMGWYLKKFIPGNKMVEDFVSVIYFMSGAAFCWGLVFGEFFGEMWESLGLWEPLFNRRERPMDMLLAVFVFGALNVATGTLIGAMVGFRLGEFKKMMVKSADFAIVAIAAWIAWEMYSGMQPSISLIPLVIALIVKAWFGGAEIMETPKLVSNILSHARLMALGYASVLVADMAGKAYMAAGDVFSGLIVATGFHMLSFVMGVYSPAIQAARLNFVEFCGQFYEFGRVKFAPLKNA